MKNILVAIALLTITTNAIAEEDMVCRKTTTFDSAADGSTIIITRTICESK
jgi:hypothetical protein